MAINLADLTNGKTVTKQVDGINTYAWQGTAVFDVLVRMVNENLKIQYDEGRIKATDYAEAYIAGLQTCITEAMKFIMQKDIANEEARLKAAQANAVPLQTAKEIDLKQAQIHVANEEKRLKSAQANAYPEQAIKDALLKQAQIDLYTRQNEGFDDNKRQKLFDSSVNGWALAYSSGILDKATIPSFINDASMTELFTTIKG